MGMGADSEVLTMSVSRRGRDAGVGGDKCPNSANSSQSRSPSNWDFK